MVAKTMTPEGRKDPNVMTPKAYSAPLSPVLMAKLEAVIREIKLPAFPADMRPARSAEVPLQGAAAPVAKATLPVQMTVPAHIIAGSEIMRATRMLHAPNTD